MNRALLNLEAPNRTGARWTPSIRCAVFPMGLITVRVLLVPVALRYKLGAIRAGQSRELAALVAFRGMEAAEVRELGVALIQVGGHLPKGGNAMASRPAGGSAYGVHSSSPASRLR